MLADADPAPPPPARPRRRRRALLIGLTLLVVAGAVVAAVSVTSRPAARPAGYASIPAPCALVPAATVARNVPGAVSAVSGPSASGTIENGICVWTDLVNGAARFMTAQVLLYRSPTAVADAKKNFAGMSVTLECKCTLATRSLTGLGSRAKAQFTNVKTGAVDTAGTGYLGGRAVMVETLSENAIVIVEDGLTSYARSVPLPAMAAMLADLTAETRRILADLAHPGAVPAVPPTATPRYSVPAHPCNLVTGPILQRYLQLYTFFPSSAPAPPSIIPGAKTAYCSWGGRLNGTVLSVSTELYPDPGGVQLAQREEQASAADETQSTVTGGLHTVFDGAQPLAGVGDEAILVFQTMKTPSLGSRATTYYAQLIVWSGNAVLDVSFNYLPGTAILPQAGALPPRPAQVSALIAVARTVLANLPRSARS